MHALLITIIEKWTPSVIGFVFLIFSAFFLHAFWILYVYIGEVIAEAYELEYGTDCLEMHVEAVHPGERAIVIDDLVATGGTLSAAIRLLGKTLCFLLLIIPALLTKIVLKHEVLLV